MSSVTDRDRVRRLERRLARERAARRDAERIAEDALRHGYAANELKTVLLGTVNHELRTPAAIIEGFSRQLADYWDDYDDAGRIDLARRIATKAAALSGLIDQLLDLATLEVGAADGGAEDVQLAPWLAVIVVDPRDDDHEVRLDVPPDLVVHVHRAALRHIITNLVGNARRYAPAGTVIDVAAQVTDAGLELSVSDEGPGIPVEDRMHVFEPFQRGSGAHVAATTGFGIGLAVVRRLTTVLGGEVILGHAVGGGAEFRLCLPAVAHVADVGTDGAGDGPQ